MTGSFHEATKTKPNIHAQSLPRPAQSVTHPLTTDLRTSGSRAAAEIHDRVREDLLVDDIADEGQSIGRDLLTPIVQARLGGDVPVPGFRRSLVQAVDTKVLVETLAVAVNELGLAVPRRWVHQALGIPEPQDDEGILSAEGAA